MTPMRMGMCLLLARIHHGLHPLFAADVAGVDADFGRAALCRGDGQPVIKMDIRYQGQGRVRLQMSAKLRAASMSGTASRAIWHPAEAS